MKPCKRDNVLAVPCHYQNPTYKRYSRVDQSSFNLRSQRISVTCERKLSTPVLLQGFCTVHPSEIVRRVNEGSRNVFFRKSHVKFNFVELIKIN